MSPTGEQKTTLVSQLAPPDNTGTGTGSTVDDATKINDLSEAYVDIGGVKFKLIYLLGAGGGLLLVAVLLSIKK